MMATDSKEKHGMILVDFIASGARTTDGRYQAILPGLQTADCLPQKS
jgi:hypothetical protein